MILDNIVALVLRILSGVISLFPIADNGVITFITSSATTAYNFLNSLNFVIDVYTLGLVLGICILMELTILGVHVVQWVLQNVSAGFYHPTK